jgi:hypothetical protein
MLSTQSSRRRFLGLAGASLLTPLAGACGGGGGSGGGYSSPAPTGGASSSASSSVDTTAALAAAAWTKQPGPAIDMSTLIPTFDTSFTAGADLSKITVTGAAGPWFAPVRPTIGAARFASPLEINSPFTLTSEGLRIRCEQVGGAWQTGHMQTCDFAGNGFAQRRGYFEMRAKFPPAGTKGAWPAFWLYNRTFYTDPTQRKVEIDVIEWYATDAKGHHSSLHLRPPAQPGPNETLTTEWFRNCYNGLPALADGQFHTHGVEITADWIIIYFDRVEIKRIPLVADFDVPLFMLVTLQLNPDEAALATGPIDYVIDYVRAWIRPTA